MATDLDDRPADAGSDSLNPGQKHADSVFDDLSSREQDSKDGGTASKSGARSLSKQSSAEGDGISSTSSDAEASRLGKVKGLYNKGKDTKRRVRSRARGMLKKKWLIGIGVGGGGVVVILMLLLLLIAALKIPHLAQNITSYQFVRVTRNMRANTSRLLQVKTAISSATKSVSDRVEARYSSVGKVRDAYAKLDKFRPQKIINIYKSSGEASLIYGKDKFGRQVLKGFQLNNKTVPIKNLGIVKRFIPGFQLANNVRFAQEVAPTLTAALKSNDIGPITRWRIMSAYRKEIGISLIAWKAGEYTGKTPSEARLQQARDDYRKTKGDTAKGAKTAGLDDSAKAASEAGDKAVANDKELTKALNEKGKIKRVANAIADSFNGSVFSKALGVVNGVYGIAMPVCIIYDGSIERAGPTIDQQMDAQVTAYHTLASAADEQKDGNDAAPEAVGAFNKKYENIDKSIAMQRSAGVATDTSGYPSVESGGAGGSYSIADALFGNSAAAAAVNTIAEKACPALTRTDLAIAVGLGNLVLAGVSLGGTQAAETAASRGATTLVGRFAEKIAATVIRKRGAVNVSGKIGDVITGAGKSTAKIVGLTLLAKLYVMTHSGYLNNGLEQSEDAVAVADSGANITAGEANRRQFFARPLTKQEVAARAADNVSYLNQENASKSLYQRYFAISNSQSLLTKFGASTASALSTIRIPSLLKNLGNLLDPTTLFSGLFNRLNPGVVHAAAIQNATQSNYGNIQFDTSRAEEALLDSNDTYQYLENQRILTQSGHEDAIAEHYGKCFTETIGTLLQDRDIQLDDDNNVKPNKGLCSPNNLSYNNTDPDGGCGSQGCGDLVFRYRTARSYDNTLDQLVDNQEVTADPVTTKTQETTFTAASYNIDHAVSYPDDKCLPSEPAKTAATPEYPNGFRAACVERRSKQQASVILGNSGSPKFDIVGLQEVSQPQQTSLLANLPGYAMYPAQVPKFHGVAIAWDAGKFSQAGQGTLKTINNSAEPANLPWVALKAGTQTYYVISVHAPNNANGGSPAIRKKMADTIRAWAKTKETDNAVVLVMGDFNEQLGGANNMCVALTQKAILQNTIDMANNKSPAKPCPSKGTNRGIDHVYASPVTGLTATGWTHMANTAPNVKQSSDHQPTHVTLTYSTGGGAQFRIASINVLGTNHEGPSNSACKRAPARPAPTGDACDRYRASVLARIVGGEQIGKPINIFGANEVTRQGLKNIQSSLGSSWESWPKKWKPRYSQDTIFYDSSKFTFVEGGGVAYPYFRAASYAPWVKLRDSQGKTMYVYNIHPPANVNDYNRTMTFKGQTLTAPAIKRKVAAQEVVADIKSRVTDGSSVFITGDMNSRADLGKNDGALSSRSELPYCIFTTGTGIGNAYDLEKGKSGEKCPTKKGFQIDQVYASNNLKVTYFAEPKDGLVRQMTDHHNIAVADIGEDAASSKKAPAVAQKITKVLTIVEENTSYDTMKATMPNVLKMAKKYGYASNYSATTHPSLPNYLAIASGSTQGVTDDKTAAVHKLSGQTVFGQAIAKGKTAKLYAQGMPSNCVLNDKTGKNYQTKHNPWAYFTAERSLCNKYDVPFSQFNRDVAQGTLPNVGMVIPDMCYDAHDCSRAKADGWFKARMDTIFSGADWKSGNLVVILTTDEDHRDANNHVLTVVMHPGLKGQVIDTALNHYSLSRFYSNVVGAQGLKNAKGAPSLSDAFGFSF